MVWDIAGHETRILDPMLGHANKFLNPSKTDHYSIIGLSMLPKVIRHFADIPFNELAEILDIRQPILPT